MTKNEFKELLNRLSRYAEQAQDEDIATKYSELPASQQQELVETLEIAVDALSMLLI